MNPIRVEGILYACRLYLEAKKELRENPEPEESESYQRLMAYLGHAVEGESRV